MRRSGLLFAAVDNKKIYAELNPTKTFAVKEMLHKFWKIAPWAGTILVIGLYYYTIARFAINFPRYDDFVAVFDFLLTYQKTDSISEKVKLLFQQHNEHRIIISRIVSVLQYELVGSINFYWQIILGNLGLLLVWISAIVTLKTLAIMNDWIVFAATLLLFQFQYYEISFFAMASLSGIWVIGLAASSLYFLQISRKYIYFYISVVLAVITTFTQGNGWLVFPTGAMLLVLNKAGTSKLRIWVATAFIMLVIYMFTYIPPTINAPTSDLPFNLKVWSGMVFFLSFMGANWLASNVLMAVAGLILLMVTALVYWKGRKKIPAFYFSFLCFLILTALVTSYSRSPLGIEVVRAPRYLVNHAAYYFILALMAGLILPQNILKPTLVVVISAAAIFNYQTYESKIRWMLYGEKRTQQFLLDIKNGHLPAVQNFFWNMPDKDYPIRILQKSKSAGIF